VLTVEVKIGRVSAACPGCGGERFLAPRVRPKSMDVLTCGDCGTKVTYILLLQQITQKSMAASDEAIEAARSQRRRDATS